METPKKPLRPADDKDGVWQAVQYYMRKNRRHKAWTLKSAFSDGSNGLILPVWDPSSMYINSDGSEYTLKSLFNDGSNGLILPIWDLSSMDINSG